MFHIFKHPYTDALALREAWIALEADVVTFQRCDEPVIFAF